MLEWVHHLQHQKKRLKSQLYKEMLDNQILLKQYYQRQRLAHSDVKKGLDDNHGYRHKEAYHNRNMLNRRQYGSILPRIQNQSRFYIGSSRYKSIDSGIRKTYINNTNPSEQNYESSSSEVEEIIKQLQSINDKTHRNNLRNSRKLKLGRKLKKIKQQQTIKHNSSDIISTEGFDANPYHSLNYKSKSSQRVNDKANEVQFLSPQHFQKIQQLKAAIQNPTPDILNSKSDRSKGSERGSSGQMKRQRQKFLDILKKVNNRGKNLVVRVSNFPSPNQPDNPE